MPFPTLANPLAFTDCETPHLIPRGRVPWEIAIIIREPDEPDCEYLWQVRPDLATADTESLAIGRYAERFAVPEGAEAIYIHPDGPVAPITRAEVADAVRSLLDGAVLAGSNAPFDAAWLGELLYTHDLEPAWHYRPYDLVALAAGRLLATPGGIEKLGWPWSSTAVSSAFGVPRPADDEAHTALGDARWHRNVWDAATALLEQL